MAIEHVLTSPFSEENNDPAENQTIIQILDRAERRLQSLDARNWSGLDYIEWELVENWCVG